MDAYLLKNAAVKAKWIKQTIMNSGNPTPRVVFYFPDKNGGRIKSLHTDHPEVDEYILQHPGCMIGTYTDTTSVGQIAEDIRSHAEEISAIGTVLVDTLYLPVKAKWFDLIKAGRKTEEYRLYNDHWRKRIMGKTFNKVVITLGYPRLSDTQKRLVFPWKGYHLKEIVSEEWHNVPKMCFAIRLQK